MRVFIETWECAKKEYQRKVMGRLKKKRTVTVFPMGTIVKFDGIPCELLRDTPFYSATFQPREDRA